MSEHERLFHHSRAHRLDDPERQKWMPTDTLVQRLALRPGMRVADIGAGTGYFALPMARAVAPGGRVLAVDVQPEMLALLRARLEPDLPVTLFQGDATHTTLPDASVDVILLANVWHELDDHAASLAEATRVLGPGGRLAILDWRTDVAQPPGPPLAHRVAEGDVRAALRHGGWNVGETEAFGLFSYWVVATRG